jgi:tetratricopeptide (TPR) repeat protein
MSQSVPDPADHTMQIDFPAERSFASGRYVVRRVLPEGGQKAVYVVYDSALDRECALALIKTDALEPQELERFRREARAMARLDHPNIVALYDIGEDGGRAFFVCQYISGGDLRGALREAGGPLPIERTLSIAEDLCRALAFAHEHGIVHRDVKPANIWLTSDGAAKLGDFGLAIAVGQSRVTLAGSVVGTAAYMAPEQAHGQPADARSDLYALGCVLYEMLTGQPPFPGADALAVISQHVNTAPVAPSWHNAEAPRPLEALTLRLLAKAPAERPASALEVAQELRHIRAQSAEEPPPAPQPATTDLRGLDWGRFVGRREEMDQLKDALDGALSAKAALIFVVGEPGIGKTRLAEEFAVHAELRGARVLSGRGYEGESSLPYTPFIEALRQYTRSRPDDELRTQLGPGAPEIATLVSEIRTRFPDIEGAPKLDGEAERLRLFESVTEFLRNAAGANPVVLFLDDLHWADKPSLLLLQHLAQRTARDRLLILGAYRDVELDRTHPLSEVLGALRRLPNYQRVLLRGLPQQSVIDLLTAIDPSEEGAAGRQALAAALYQETEGNPFFIREVMAHLIETGKIVHENGRWVGQVTSISELGIPEGVREVVGRRLSRLSEGCNHMLTLASTMAGGFSWEELKAICDEPEARLLDLLEEALRAQIIAERRGEAGGRYEFTHALIRQTLYEELSTPRRVLLHRQIGEALDRLYAANVEPHLAELAHHFCQAAPGGDIDRAINYATRAAEQAANQVAHEEAARLYQMALQALDLQEKPDEARRCDLLLALCDAQARAGELNEAMTTGQQAAEIARQLGDPKRLGHAAFSFSGGKVQFLSEVNPVEVALLEEALAASGDQDSSMRARLLARLSLVLTGAPDSQERRAALADEAIRAAESVGDPGILSLALAARIVALAESASGDDRLALANNAVQSAEEAGDAELIAIGHLLRLDAFLALGHTASIEGEVDVLTRLDTELRLPILRWDLQYMRLLQPLWEGRFEAAEGLVQQTAAMVTPSGSSVNLAVQIFAIRREQGRLEELEGALAGSVKLNPEIPAQRAALAFLYSEVGREVEARNEFELLAASGFDELLRHAFSGTTSLVLLSETCAVLGDANRAALLYELLQPLAGRNLFAGIAGNRVAFLGCASRTLGLLATTLARWSDAQQHFEDALNMHSRMRARPWVARTQHDYAKMLLARGAPGDRERALDLLQQALDAAQEMGMKKVIEDCLALKVQAQDIDRSSS